MMLGKKLSRQLSRSFFLNVGLCGLNVMWISNLDKCCHVLEISAFPCVKVGLALESLCCRSLARLQVQSAR